MDKNSPSRSFPDIPKKAFVSRREPPISRRFTETSEANFLDGPSPQFRYSSTMALELEENLPCEVESFPTHSALEQGKEDLQHEKSPASHVDRVLSAPELEEDSSYPVFDSLGSCEDSLDSSSDVFSSRRVIKPSKSFTNLLNSTSSSANLSVSSCFTDSVTSNTSTGDCLSGQGAIFDAFHMVESCTRGPPESREKPIIPSLSSVQGDKISFSQTANLKFTDEVPADQELPSLMVVENFQESVYQSTPSRPEDTEGLTSTRVEETLPEFLDSPVVAVGTFAMSVMVDSPVNASTKKQELPDNGLSQAGSILEPTTSDLDHIACNNSRLNPNRAILDESTNRNSRLDPNRTILGDSLSSQADCIQFEEEPNPKTTLFLNENKLCQNASKSSLLPSTVETAPKDNSATKPTEVPIASRPKLLSTDSLFSFKKYKKVDLDCFAAKSPAPKKVAAFPIISFQSESSSNPLYSSSRTTKLGYNFLGRDFLSHLSSLLKDQANDHCRTAAIASWMLEEGLLKSCQGKLEEFEANLLYLLCCKHSENLEGQGGVAKICQGDGWREARWERSHGEVVEEKEKEHQT